MDENQSNQNYWATTEPEELAQKLVERREAYYNYLEGTGRLALWRKSHRLYYGVDDEGTSTSFSPSYGGQQGEVTLLKVNQYYSFLEHIYVLITGTRPTLRALGVNNSNKAQTAAKLAEGVFEYYLREGRLEKTMQLACKYALRFGEGWVYSGWDTNAGERPIDAFQEELDGMTVDVPVYKGDISSVALAPYDVIRDTSVDIGSKEELWTMVHQGANKWDLVALYPKFKDDIVNAPFYDFLNGANNVKVRNIEESGMDCDLVSVFEFFHKSTPALPEGRMCIMVGDKILFDGPLPYNKLPTMVMRPDVETRSAFGYSNAFNLMGLQDIYDSIFSTIASKHDAYGLPDLWAPPGGNTNVKDLTTGLTVIESEVKPEVLDLMPDISKSSNFLEITAQLMSTLSGINDVARGNPESNIKSGNMAALIHAMAVQYNSGLQASYAQLFERLGTHFLDISRKFIKNERLINMVGPQGQAWTREFKGSDLEGVDQIVVETSNALLRTTAGRQQVADTLLQAQMLKSPEQYLSVISTGRLENILDLPNSKLRNVLAENDLMSKGEMPMVSVMDHHFDHIKAHETLLNEPENRKNNELMETVLVHIQEHIDAWQKLTTNNPAMLKIIDLPELPQPAPAPAPAMPEMSGQGPSASQDTMKALVESPASSPAAATNPADLGNVGAGLEGTTGVKLPKPPVNPITGEPTV